MILCPRDFSGSRPAKRADGEWRRYDRHRSIKPTKRSILDHLKPDELLAAVDRFELDVSDRRVRVLLIEAGATSRRARLDAILAGFSRDRLKELCRALDLDDGGREKAVIVERLTGQSAATSTQPTPAPSPERVCREDPEPRERRPAAPDPRRRREQSKELAGAELLLVPDADHLEAIQRAGDDVVGLALATFERAEHHVPLLFFTTPYPKFSS